MDLDFLPGGRHVVVAHRVRLWPTPIRVSREGEGPWPALVFGPVLVAANVPDPLVEEGSMLLLYGSDGGAGWVSASALRRVL